MAGEDVTLVHRDRSVVQAVQKRGVSLTERDGRIFRVRVPTRQGPTSLKGNEVVIVTVKAYDTKEVANSYRTKISGEISVLTLQNGLGNFEALQSGLRSNHIVGGSTTEAALSNGLGSVVHTGKGLTVIGELNRIDSQSLFRIKRALDNAGFHTMVSSQIRGVLWTKAIVNAAINPLSGLTGLPNGVLAKSSAIRNIAFQVIDEGLTVSRSARVRLVGRPRLLWERILMSTGLNESSMLQDLKKGKMTEIEQLNGAIARLGRNAGVNTPVNEILTRLILRLEQSSRSVNNREKR